MNQSNNEVMIYEDGIKVNVRFLNEDLWIAKYQLVEIYKTTRQNIEQHIKNIYQDNELNENETCKKFLQIQKEGNREVKRKIDYYNLDMVIALGYRIKSDVAIRIRVWATERLPKYIQKDFGMCNKRLKLGGNRYCRRRFFKQKKRYRKINKLIRDNIPAIIEQNNETPFTRILDDDRYRIELYKKLQEECNEVIQAKKSDEILEELSDVFEVLKAIAKLENATIDDIIGIANQKRLKRGGFEKRIFLEKTITK